MNINQIRLYDLFRKELHLPDNKASAFVQAVGDMAESEVTAKYYLLATKEDIHILKSNFNALKDHGHVLKNDFHVLKNDVHDLKGDMRSLRGDLELKIEQSKSDICKAIFLSGIIQFIAILSGTLAIVKFMK